MTSLAESDREAEAHAKGPRIRLADIEANIAARYDTTGDQLALAAAEKPHPALKVLSVCVVVMQNGYTVIGHSAPAAPENFNRDLGRKLAYDNCLKQLWPLMGFCLRDRLHAEEAEHGGR